MKKLALALSVIVLCAGPVLAKGSHATKGYVKKNGTYVAPAHATNPDKSKSNNWSTKPNANPYTGKEGTKSDKP